MTDETNESRSAERTAAAETLAYWTMQPEEEQALLDRCLLMGLNHLHSQHGLPPVDLAGLEQWKAKLRRESDLEDLLDSKRSGMIFPEDMGGL